MEKVPKKSAPKVVFKFYKTYVDNVDNVDYLFRFIQKEVWLYNFTARPLSTEND
jgi:hypothetical protein